MKTYVPAPRAVSDIMASQETTFSRILGKISSRISAAAFALLGYAEKKENTEKKETPGLLILPMSSKQNIPPNMTVQVTARPQNMAFRPERIVIGGTPSDWIINDVKVGNRSQLLQSGDTPGELFAATATINLPFLSLETVHTAGDFVIVVTYVGKEKDGAPFICSALGTAVI
jgi:hypothetical protein